MPTADQSDSEKEAKPLFWISSSLKDLRRFPKAVRSTFGQALYDAPTGGKHPLAKPLKGFGGSGVLEIVEDDCGNAYRGVYTVKFAGIVYVLHAFQKKSKAGIKTSTEDLERIRNRLKEAERHYDEWNQK